MSEKESKYNPEKGGAKEDETKTEEKSEEQKKKEEEEEEEKRMKKLPPLEQTWKCSTCKRVNPSFQKVVGTKLLIDVEFCSVCQTARPEKKQDDEGEKGPTAGEKLNERAEEMKQKMKAGLLARWNKKKREREEKLILELSKMKPYKHARGCLKAVVPGPKPKIIPPLAIDESLEPGTLVPFICNHGLNGAPTRRVPLGETCPYCRKLAERRLWSWLENHYVYTRAFDEMEYGETQTVRYWGDEPVGAKKPKGPQCKDKEVETNSNRNVEGFEEKKEEKEGNNAKKTLEKISNAHVGDKNGLITETFAFRDWEHTLHRLNNKDKFGEVSLLCLAFEPETFWNTIRFYNVAACLEDQDRLDRQMGKLSPLSESIRSSPILHLNIKHANGLRKADYFGLSDPYAIVYFDGKEVGRTEIIPDNLDPVWNHKIEINTTGINWTVVRLQIDLWDSDFMVQNPLTDDFLGQIRLAGDLLKTFLQKESPELTMYLERKRGVGGSFMEGKDAAVNVQGTITIHGELASPPLTPQERRRLKKKPERGDGDWALGCRSWRNQALKKWDKCFNAFRDQKRAFSEALRVPKLLEPVLVGVFSQPEEIEEFREMLKNAEYNAEIDDRGQIYGFTALHIAAQKNLPDIVSLLLDAGAAIDPYDFSGSTPLHIACREGFDEVVLLLQKLGANIWCKDRARNDCFDILHAHGHKDLAKRLSSTLVFNEEILWRARRFYKDLMWGRADMYDQRHMGRRYFQGKMFACAFATRKKKLLKTLKDPKFLRKQFCVSDLYDSKRRYELGIELWNHKPSTVPTWERIVLNWKATGNRDDKKSTRLKALQQIYIYVLGYDPKYVLKGMPGGVEEFMTRLDYAEDNLFQVWRKKKGMPKVDVEYEMNFGKKKGMRNAESALKDLLAKRSKKDKDGKKKKKKKKKKNKENDGESGGE
jgi:hypothetical protein